MKKIDLLIKAKVLYEHLIPDPIGMCHCFNEVLRDQDNSLYSTRYVSYRTLFRNFPEFNPTYFKSTNSICGFWWDIEDTESRLKAFDTLIELYKNNTKEFANDTDLLGYFEII